MRSMTGFGAATVADAKVSVTVEVRSVNHRFLQVKSRLPADLAVLESDVDALVKKRLGRGAVNVTVRVEPVGSAAEVRVDTELVERYRDQLADLARSAGVSETLSLAEWTRLPGVLETRSASFDRTHVARVIAKATAEALDALVSMRDAEGAALAKDLAKNAAALGKVVVRIAGRAPAAVKRHQDELRQRIAQLLDRPVVEADELAREVAAIADRADVAEELSRLEAHLEALDLHVSDAAKAGGKAGAGVGRTLDFLVQEVFREVNTIGSKSSDTKIAHWVVDAKTLTERLREQVQNVE